MNIGVFDSGLGGLIILKALRDKLPQFNYVFLGDTKNSPYGDKSQDQIYKLTKKGIEFLFSKDCEIVLLMCNTASTQALRKLQQEFLPKKYPNRRILGPIVPTVQTAINSKVVAVVATKSTVNSKAYIREFNNYSPKTKVTQKAAPKVVPALESGNTLLAEKELLKVIASISKNNIDGLILGCTHYSLLKKQVKKAVGKNVKVYSQDEFLPKQVSMYLTKHKELASKLTTNQELELYVSKKTEGIENKAREWFGDTSSLKQI